MKSIFAFLLFALSSILIGCNTLVKPKSNIDVYINPNDSGWYFIELIADTAAPVGDVTIHYDTIGGLPQVPVHSMEDYNFRIFGHGGEKISAQSKMPGFVYHTSGHHFFRFYYPSARALNDEQNWDPQGSNMERLRENSITELNRLLNRAIDSSRKKRVPPLP